MGNPLSVQGLMECSLETLIMGMLRVKWTLEAQKGWRLCPYVALGLFIWYFSLESVYVAHNYGKEAAMIVRESSNTKVNVSVLHGYKQKYLWKVSTENLIQLWFKRGRLHLTCTQNMLLVLGAWRGHGGNPQFGFFR